MATDHVLMQMLTLMRLRLRLWILERERLRLLAELGEAEAVVEMLRSQSRVKPPASGSRLLTRLRAAGDLLQQD